MEQPGLNVPEEEENSILSEYAELNDDVLDDSVFSRLRVHAWGGHYFAILGGPVCSTWSRPRVRPGGTPPLRSRCFPFGLLELHGAQLLECRRGA